MNSLKHKFVIERILQAKKVHSQFPYMFNPARFLFFQVLQNLQTMLWKNISRTDVEIEAKIGIIFEDEYRNNTIDHVP